MMGHWQFDAMRGAEDGWEDAKQTGVHREHLKQYGAAYRSAYERAFKRQEAEQHEEFRREGVIDELRSRGYDASL